jgi:hypothetical protein
MIGGTATEEEMESLWFAGHPDPIGWPNQPPHSSNELGGPCNHGLGLVQAVNICEIPCGNQCVMPSESGKKDFGPAQADGRYPEKYPKAALLPSHSSPRATHIRRMPGLLDHADCQAAEHT